MNFKPSRFQGFTLIELVVVIVILGILAAVAAPKFMDLQRDARIAKLYGIAGGIKGANEILHAYAVVHGLDNFSLDPDEGDSSYPASAVKFNGSSVVRGTGGGGDNSFFLNYGYVAVTWGTDRNSGLAQVIDKKAYNPAKNSAGSAGTVANYNTTASFTCPTTDPDMELCYVSGTSAGIKWKKAYLVMPGYTALECSIEYDAASLDALGKVVPPKVILHTSGC